MQYHARTFFEKEGFGENNPRMANNIRTAPAVLLTGEPGIFLRIGKTHASLTIGQAIEFATLIANTVDEVKGMTAKE